VLNKVHRYLLFAQVVAYLNDNATGEMWTWNETADVIEARVVAWVPMQRADDNAEGKLGKSKR
jgi:hypothetical protein